MQLRAGRTEMNGGGSGCGCGGEVASHPSGRSRTKRKSGEATICRCLMLGALICSEHIRCHGDNRWHIRGRGMIDYFSLCEYEMQGVQAVMLSCWIVLL